MSSLTDHIAGLLRGAQGNRVVAKAGTVDGAGQVSSVPTQGNRTQPSQAGGGSRSEALSTPGGDDGPNRQVNRPGPWSNVDTEAAASHGPGSLVAAALARGRANIQRYPVHTIAGALNEAALRHQVTVFGHAGGPDASAEEVYQGTLVGVDHDDDPAVFASFQATVNRMCQAFYQSVGRYPQFGVPRDANDVAFQQAYAALREKYWPSGGVQGSDVVGGQGDAN